MKEINIDKTTQDVLMKIHDQIYKKINQNYIDVFLCGGASKEHIRDVVRKSLDRKRNIRILYPEDLFIEMLNKDKGSDLLSLESFLADNCDIICIICESAGSLVELGAFTNNKDTMKKVIAVIEEKRKRDKSFIMLGPIKVIQKNDEKNVVFYSKENISELNNKLGNIFTTNRINKLKSAKTSIEKSINSIIGLYYFIPLILYFFNTVEVVALIVYLKYLFVQNSYDSNDFERVFKSSLRLLHKDKYIQKGTLEEKAVYTLTEKGYENVNAVMRDVNIKNRTGLYDYIRFGIMKIKYYNQRRSP